MSCQRQLPSVCFTPDGHGLFYSRMDAKRSLLYEHKWGERISHDTLLFGKEFRGEELGPSDLILAYVTDDAHYLVRRSTGACRPGAWTLFFAI
jgi:prolyl oligopeptidase